jgi:hypothetical protein
MLLTEMIKQPDDAAIPIDMMHDICNNRDEMLRLFDARALTDSECKNCL